MSPNEILEAAQELGKGEGEVDWRNAASRAYYAVYHRSIRIAEAMGFEVQGQAVHRSLYEALTDNRSPKSTKALGFMLEQSRRFRVRADSRIGDDFPISDCRTALEQAQRLMAKADTIEDAS